MSAITRFFSLRYCVTILTGTILAAGGGAMVKIYGLPPLQRPERVFKLVAPKIGDQEKIKVKPVNLLALRAQMLASSASSLIKRTHQPENDVLHQPAKPATSLSLQHQPVTNQSPIKAASFTNEPRYAADPVMISQLPKQLRMSIPPFIYNAHVFSSQAAASYIQLDGHTLYQKGHYHGLTVVHILYGKTIFKYKGRLIEQPALEDHKQ